MRKNSIDIYTSQHVYPANSFRDSPSERFGFGFGFGFGKRGMTSWQEFCYEQEMEKGKAFIQDWITWEASHSSFHFYVSTSI